MPIYTVKGPDGRTYKIQGPEGATAEQLGKVITGNASEPTMLDSIKQGAGNLLAGAVRGAGSIGATLVAPFDIAKDAIDGKGLSLESNRQRRADMDAALQSMGADTDSMLYSGGKLAAEIAGTAGIGGALAKPIQALAATKYAQGIEPLLEGAARSLQTGGFRVGPLAGTGAGTAMRVAGGAVGGGAAAGLVNPEDAGTGALIGAALPAAVQASGKIGGIVREKLANASPANLEQRFLAAQKGANAGYVVPPADLQPGALTEMLSGLSGKIKTAQVASQRNQEVTNKLARQALGMSGDEALTIEVLDNFRKTTAQPYRDISALGEFSAKGAQLPSEVKVINGIDPLMMGKTQSVDAAELVRAWKQSNHEATAYYRAYGIDANPETLAKAKAASDAAKQIDNFLTDSLAKTGNGKMVDALKDARVKLAKSYSVEKALNAATGDVSAPALAKQLEKGKPLSGELRTIAEVAQAFPKATQMLKEAPKTFSPLDFLAAGGAGLASPIYATSILARPAARQYLLSPMAQKAALRMPGLLSNPEDIGLLTQGAYRVAPLLATD